METMRYFGPVRAVINHSRKTVELMLKRGADPLPAQTVRKCAAWAVKGVKDLVDDGYSLDDKGLSDQQLK
jgi:hypothetical protein